MIGYLSGTVVDTNGKKAIILTPSGVGYEINYGHYLAANSECNIFIHHHISENDQSLWGFNSLSDKKMFELLKTVNKVGSSKAYPLISVVGTDAVIQAIMFDQPNVLSQAQGIGNKMAEQIILSLKDKIEKFSAANIKTDNVLENSPSDARTDMFEQKEKVASKFDIKLMKEAMQALDALGYKDSEVAGLVKNQLVNGVGTSEEVIKNILREL